MDLISRQAAIDAVLDRMNVEKHGRDAKPEEIQWTLEKLPSVQPEHLVKESGNLVNGLVNDCISRQAAIDAVKNLLDSMLETDTIGFYEIENILFEVPSAQPEIIRCNVCRHWHQTTGEMKGFGLGDCDYLEKKLVTCNGYCYWAERKEDE